MAIRAFLSTWSVVNGEITHPILEHVDQQPPMGITLSMTFNDANANGVPDKPVVLVLAHSNQVNGNVLEQLKNLNGVTLIPAGRPDKAIDTLPPTAKADLDGLANATYGIPQSAINTATTLGEALTNISNYINPNATGIQQYISQRPLEFG